MYSKEFKLECITSFKENKESIGQTARLKSIPKQTLARWIKTYDTYGEKGIENRKPGAREKPIDPEAENAALEIWKKGERSAYRMRLDLRGLGFKISEKQVKKIYRKNGLLRNQTQDTPVTLIWS